MCLKKIGCLFSYFSAHFLKIFSLFQNVNNYLNYCLLNERFASTKRASVSNLSFSLFSLSCCLLLHYWLWRYFCFLGGTLQWKYLNFRLIGLYKTLCEWCCFQLLRKAWLLVWDLPVVIIIYINILANDVKFFGKEGKWLNHFKQNSDFQRKNFKSSEFFQILWFFLWI